MRKTLQIIFYLLGGLGFTIGEILLANSPFGIFSHLHLIIVFYSLFIVLAPDPVSLLPLPLSGLILEQFTSLPFGVMSFSLTFSFVTTFLVIRNFVTNRSIWAVGLVSAVVSFLYQSLLLISRSLIFPNSTTFNFLNISSDFINYVLIDSLLTSLTTVIMFFIISRSSRRFNPKYILSSKRSN